MENPGEPWICIFPVWKVEKTIFDVPSSPTPTKIEKAFIGLFLVIFLAKVSTFYWGEVKIFSIFLKLSLDTYTFNINKGSPDIGIESSLKIDPKDNRKTLSSLSIGY